MLTVPLQYFLNDINTSSTQTSLELAALSTLSNGNYKVLVEFHITSRNGTKINEVICMCLTDLLHSVGMITIQVVAKVSK